MLRRNLLLVTLLVISVAFAGCIGPFAKKEATKIEAGADKKTVSVIDGDVDVKLTAVIYDQKDKEYKVSEDEEKEVKWEITKGKDLAELAKDTGLEVTLKAKAVGDVEVTVKFQELDPAVVKITITEDEIEEDENGEVESNVLVDEDFSADDIEHFFSADYKSFPNDPTKPLYLITGGGGNMVLENNTLTLVGGRFTIGTDRPKDDTNNDIDDGEVVATSPGGVLDLSKPWKITIEVSDADQLERDGSFQVYVDNNTTKAADSIHKGASRIINEKLSGIEDGTIVFESELGTENSFIQIRTDQDGKITLHSIKIEYQ